MLEVCGMNGTAYRVSEYSQWFTLNNRLGITILSASPYSQQPYSAKESNHPERQLCNSDKLRYGRFSATLICGEAFFENLSCREATLSRSRSFGNVFEAKGWLSRGKGSPYQNVLKCRESSLRYLGTWAPFFPVSRSVPFPYPAFFPPRWCTSTKAQPQGLPSGGQKRETECEECLGMGVYW